MGKIKIAVIDDEAAVRRSLKNILEKGGGYDVVTAEDGKEGIKLVRKAQPDLVLLDIVMPGWDGFEVLKRLKENYKTMSIPVIVLSAYASEENRIKGSRLYTDLYLAKPISPDELLEKVALVLRRKNLI
jgi:DNA-binding response OmpR family regulator